jgi:hypothetical protein
MNLYAIQTIFPNMEDTTVLDESNSPSFSSAYDIRRKIKPSSAIKNYERKERRACHAFAGISTHSTNNETLSDSFFTDINSFASKRNILVLIIKVLPLAILSFLLISVIENYVYIVNSDFTGIIPSFYNSFLLGIILAVTLKLSSKSRFNIK